MNSRTLIFSIIAGLVAALFAALALTRPGIFTFLLYVISVPVLFASFSWGSLAGIIAAAVAIGSTALAGGPAIAAIAAIMLAPAAYAGHLAGLSREDEEGRVHWFPLSEILFRLILTVIAGILIVGALLGYDVPTVASQLEQLMQQFLTSQAGDMTEKEIANVKANSLVYAALLPLVVSAITVAVLVWNMKLAARLARGYVGMARPKDNVAADSGLPNMALWLFAAALIVSLFVPALRSAAYVVLGATGMAIAMIGLAVLHYYTWGRRGRGQILFLTYLVIALITAPIFLFVALGIAELLFFLRARDPDRMPANPDIKSTNT